MSKPSHSLSSQPTMKSSRSSALGSVQLLSVIAPVHNKEGQITVRVEELLDILTDARVPFEFLLLDFASTDSTVDVISELGRLYPQIKSVCFPELDINAAISSAIKSATGDLIVILEEGPYAIQQLTQLLKESLQFRGTRAAVAQPERIPTNHSQNYSAFSPPANAPRDEEMFDLSGHNFQLEIPELPGIESQVLKRLETWAAALRREAELRDRVMESSERVRNESIESTTSESLPTEGDEIRRLDSAAHHPKRKLPKFITRFHEFI